MSDKVNIIIQESAGNDTGMGCWELAVSLAVLAVVLVAVTGLGLGDLLWWLLLG